MLTVVILGALFFASVVMSGALAIAWANFGRPRHAASWALSFGVGAVQALVNGLAILSGRVPALIAIAFLLIPASGLLTAIGARQRARQPSRWRWFLAIGVADGLFIILSIGVPGLDALGLGSATIVSAIGLFLAAHTVHPGNRAAEPAERALALAFAGLGAIEVAVGTLTALSMWMPQIALFERAYEALLALALPPGVVCVGAAAILLVASDLATDLRRLAARDPLTGVFNRRGFHDAAIRTLANARRLHVPLTLVLVDIDHFKTINDRWGHTAGDHVLCFIADRLVGGVRQGDIVARIGGEEFAMLLIDVALDEARDAIDRIRLDIAAGYAHEGTALPVTASFGLGDVSLVPGDLAAIIARALDGADRALYLSKIEGRNRVTVAA